MLRLCLAPIACPHNRIVLLPNASQPLPLGHWRSPYPVLSIRRNPSCSNAIPRSGFVLLEPLDDLWFQGHAAKSAAEYFVAASPILLRDPHTTSSSILPPKPATLHSPPCESGGPVYITVPPHGTR